ncbi:MAG: hypothetical protein JSW49_02440 [candidate division WOR-3 bacterium]|nr:MAG: hypothetical protein JSW49_02440 [candidate division WOR-3 bacterium]
MSRSKRARACIASALISVSLFVTACKYEACPLSSVKDKKIQIPFEIAHNVIILPVRAGNSQTLNIILDTGMHFEGLLLYNIDPEDSVVLKNPVDVQVPGAGADGPAQAAMADSMSFYVGKLECKNQKIILLKGDVMRGMASQGVTGYSLFGKYCVEVDYDRMLITLHEPSVEADSSWEWLPVTFKANNIPWIEGIVNITGAEEIPLSLYIDLASGDALELLTKDDMKFDLPENLEAAYLGTGLSGDIHGHTGKIASLRLGSFYLKNVTTAFAPAEIRSKQDNADGIVGSNALRRFNIIFDYKRGRLYLKPNTHFNKPF